MATPIATSLGHPSAPTISAVPAIVGAHDDTSGQVSSREAVCVWAAMALAIMIAEGLLVGFFQLKPFCQYDIDSYSAVFVDAHAVLPCDLLSPFFSGALLTLFVSHRHRYIAGWTLHFWTLCYGVAVFALSWVTLCLTLCRCNQEKHALVIVLSRIFAFVNALATILLIWLSLLKLRCLKAVAPSLARVGEMSGRCLAVTCLLILLWGQLLGEQDVEFLFVGPVLMALAGTASTAVYFGALVMVLSFSANSSLKEASEKDVDDESARLFKISARGTKWTTVITACSGSTFLASWLAAGYRFVAGSARAVIVSKWLLGLDLITNVAASAFLSGIGFGDGGRHCGPTILRVVASSIHSQKRRCIEQQLMSVVGASAGSALTIAYLMDGVDPADVLREAELRFRCVSWEALAARSDIIIGGGPLDVVGPGDDDLHSLSEPCNLGDCDAFVSHSWHDNGQEKWEALRSWCDNFVQAQGYHPRLWVDKVCICQKEIVKDLRCLPVFIAGCKKLIIISGPTYPTRLWCSMEVLVHRAILASDTNRCPPELLLLGDDKQRNDLQQAWRNFDVVQCNCFCCDDKRRFLEVVGRYPGGSTGFNRFVREFAADFRVLCEASTPTYDYDFVVRC